MPDEYAAAYVDQSLLLRLAPGQLAAARIRLRNVGSAAWERDGEHPVLLGTDRPLDGTSVLAQSGEWPGPNRPARLLERRVEPGAVGTFDVPFRAPVVPGRYRQALRPVVEGQSWLPSLDLELVVDVLPPAAAQPPPFAAELLEMPPPLVMRPAETGIVHVRLRNTGSVRWTHHDGSPELGPLIQLGTDDPRDHSGVLYDPESWVAPHRVARVRGYVLPGEVVDLAVVLRAPAEPGSYEDHLRVVVEGRTWLTNPLILLRALVVA